LPCAVVIEEPHNDKKNDVQRGRHYESRFVLFQFIVRHIGPVIVTYINGFFLSSFTRFHALHFVILKIFLSHPLPRQFFVIPDGILRLPGGILLPI
jgi:hypothetical protein